MFTNNQKAKQTKDIKTESDFNIILKQILNLDTQKKVTKSRLMKNASKTAKFKKSTGHPCSYYIKSGHIVEKYSYKYPD